MRYPQGRTRTLKKRAQERGQVASRVGVGVPGDKGWNSRVPFPGAVLLGRWGVGSEEMRRFPYKALQLREGDGRAVEEVWQEPPSVLVTVAHSGPWGWEAGGPGLRERHRGLPRPG